MTSREMTALTIEKRRTARSEHDASSPDENDAAQQDASHHSSAASNVPANEPSDVSGSQEEPGNPSLRPCTRPWLEHSAPRTPPCSADHAQASSSCVPRLDLTGLQPVPKAAPVSGGCALPADWVRLEPESGLTTSTGDDDTMQSTPHEQSNGEWSHPLADTKPIANRKDALLWDDDKSDVSELTGADKKSTGMSVPEAIDQVDESYRKQHSRHDSEFRCPLSSMSSMDTARSFDSNTAPPICCIGGPISGPPAIEESLR